MVAPKYKRIYEMSPPSFTLMCPRYCTYQSEKYSSVQEAIDAIGSINIRDIIIVELFPNERIVSAFYGDNICEES